MNGILMTPDNHKATRELRKTQTRRLDHLKEINKEPDRWEYLISITKEGWDFIFYNETGQRIIAKPRYRIRETVYIKEAWAIKHEGRTFSPKLNDIVRIVFSDGEIQRRYGDIAHNPIGRWLPSVYKAYDTGKWQPPMFLPELCARDFIAITDAKPQRLQDITEEDAVAEGCKAGYTIPGGHYTAVFDFMTLWNSINGKTYPWSSNPWCFAYTFQLVDKPVGVSI